jgi:hypothetical protein
MKENLLYLWKMKTEIIVGFLGIIQTRREHSEILKIFKEKSH